MGQLTALLWRVEGEERERNMKVCVRVLAAALKPSERAGHRAKTSHNGTRLVFDLSLPLVGSQELCLHSPKKNMKNPHFLWH